MRYAAARPCRLRCAGAIFLVAVVLPIPISTAALAQAGSVGGTIGKQGKSIAGGRDAAPAPQRRAPSQRAPQKPREARRAAPAPAPGDGAGRAGGGGGASLSGAWRWSANCQTGARQYSGILNLQQTGNDFSGTHGRTNIWDTGSISDGRVDGSRVSFTRTWGRFVDHIVLTLSGARMAGVIAHTEHSGRCEMSMVKN
jgi:hypothetical protein